MSAFLNGTYPHIPVPPFQFSNKNNYNRAIVEPNTPWVPAYPAQTTYPYHSPLNTSFPKTP